MERLHAIFTKRPFNPGSLVIRAANPVSICKLAPASHVILVDGRFGIEASMTHGVRRAELHEMLKGQTVVTQKRYEVPYAQKGIDWARDTAARKAKYDWPGAFGLGLAPDRDWQNEEDWFCFELFGNAMAKSGRKPFDNNARITAYMLMCLPESFTQSEKTTVVSL